MFRDSDIWEYAAYTKTAAENGGPDAFIQSIADESFERGVASGEKKGLFEATAIAVTAFIGYQGYKRLRTWLAARREPEQPIDEPEASTVEHEGLEPSMALDNNPNSTPDDEE